MTALPSWVTLSPDQTLRQMSTTSRVRPSGFVNGTPCQPSTTWAPELPMPSVKRPPDSASSAAAVEAISAGEREYTLAIPVISSIRSDLAATYPSTDT